MMPHAHRSCENKDHPRHHCEPSQSCSRCQCQRHQSCGLMTTTGREPSHQKNRTRAHHRHHHAHPHPYRHHQHSYRTHSRSRKLERIDSDYSNHPDQLFPFIAARSVQGNKLRDPRGPCRPGDNSNFPHHNRSAKDKQSKASDRTTSRSMQVNQVVDDVNSRMMMMQWNSGMFDPGKRDLGINSENTDPTGRKFPPASYFQGTLTEEQLKALNNFQKAKSQSNPDFTIPKSSLDNLLGIDAMDMYVTGNPIPGQHPLHAHGMYPGMVRSGTMTDMEGNLRGPGNRLVEFQHNCIRSLASMIVCPHTVLPITIGLFTQSGSIRDTGYLQVLGEEISHINSANPSQFQLNQIRFSLGSSLLPLIATFLIAYILGLTLGWQLGLAVAVTATLLYFIVCAVVFFGIRGKSCPKSMQFAETLSRYMRGCQLVLNILFYRAPAAPSSAQPVRLLPISLNLTGCVSGMEAAAQMTEKLWQFAEQKYGRLAVRFQWASKDMFHRSPQTCRKYCCLPLWLWLVLSIASTLSLATLLVVQKQQVAKESVEVTQRPPLIITKEPINRGPDIHVVQEHLLNVAIVCAVLSGFSALALLAASVPSMIRLLQGRPFQRRKQSTPYGEAGKLNEPPMDGCYGAGTAQCDPVSCMRFEGKANGRYNEQQQYPMHLTSAATVAATAAVAAVTAADRQWRLIEQERAQAKRSDRRRLPKSSGIKVVRQLFSPSKAVLQAAKDLESNSTDRSSRSPSRRSSSSSSQDGDHRARSRSGSDSDDDRPEAGHTVHHEAVMFESDELLIHDPQRDKRSEAKSPNLMTAGKRSPRTAGSKSTETKHMTKWKNLIRKGFMEACKVLSLIDSRMGDRQTRVVFCINANNGLPTTPASLVKLATFVRLIDRLLMQPPAGGTSNDAPVVFSSYKSASGGDSSEQKNLNPNASATTWTPNIIVLLTASVPHVQTVNNAQSAQVNSFHSQQSRDGWKSCSFAGPMSALPWTNFKLWWSIHHVCHLPIYLEEEPPGHRLIEPSGSHQSSVMPQVIQPFYNSQGPGSIFDLLLGSHELSDMNAKRLRRLLTQMAFMGRMINIERLQIERQGLVRIATTDSGILSGQIGVGALITWLCLLQHWPFHAAWLAVFLEQRLCKNGGEFADETVETTTPRRSTDAGSVGSAAPGAESDATNQLNWDSMLSQLHARILKRLAPAVEIARVKAMSVSLGAAQPGSDFNTRHLAAYPPHVSSTLEICDLAMRDRDPRRLAEFLQSTDTDRGGMAPLGDTFDFSNAFHPRMLGPHKAGAITVRQLLRVMRLTPMMNPQINQWIRDVLSSKLLMTENVLDTKSEQEMERKVSGGGASIKQQMSTTRAARSSEEKLSRRTPTHSDSTCRVKLKHGMPNKRLSQMTVEDVCGLIRNITDLSVNKRTKRKSKSNLEPSKSSKLLGKTGTLISSDESDSPINDPAPPAPISDKRKPVHETNLYEERIRHLNISGTVLSICPLSDLQKELNMSFGDWQLFSSVINHLKSKEFSDPTINPAAPNHTCGLKQNENLRRSDPRIFRGAVEQTEKWPQDSHLISTVSDTSLALTVKSVPVTNQHLSSPPISMSSAVKITKSMSALPSSSRIATRLPYTHSAQRLQPVLCPQHSRAKHEVAVRDPMTIFCPRHKEQVKSFLSGSQRELEAASDFSKRSQTDFRQKSNRESRTPSLTRRHTCGTQSKQAATGHSLAFQTSPPLCTVPLQQQTKQAQFQGERSSTLPNSFRENLPPGMSNTVHAQYCAMHQRYIHSNWPHSSQTAWMSPRTSRGGNVTGRSRGMLETTTPIEGGTRGYVPGNDRSENRSQVPRSLRSQQASNESTSKETRAFDFSTPVRQRLSKLEQLGPNSGHVDTAEFCLPKDSESTSIAGDLVEEVADFSPALLEQDSSISQDATTKDEEKIDSSDHPSSQSCDCNYWYSLEAAAAAAAAAAAGASGGDVINTGLITRSMDASAVLPKIHSYQAFDRSRDQSISDSLSTTRSHLDASSGSSSNRSTSEASSNEQLDRLG